MQLVAMAEKYCSVMYPICTLRLVSPEKALAIIGKAKATEGCLSWETTGSQGFIPQFAGAHVYSFHQLFILK